MRQNFLKTEAFVLKKKNLLNKDLLVFLFTEEKGKISVFAKGARKITSRRLSYLETGNLIKVNLTKKDEIFYLNEVELISGFLKIKENQEKTKFLYQFFFVLEKLLPENQKEKQVYDLTKYFLISISKNSVKNLKILNYLNKLLKKLGYIKNDLDKNQLENFLNNLINEKMPSFLYND